MKEDIILGLEDSWVVIKEPTSWLAETNKEIIVMLNCRVHYRNKLARKQAFKSLFESGWKHSKSDDFYKKIVIKDVMEV